MVPNREITLEYARELAHRFIITDGHVDLPYRMRIANFRLQKEFLDVSVRTDGGDFDYVRAKEGGLDAPFMSIYVPAANQTTAGKSKAVADSLIDMVEEIVRRHPDKFAIASSPNEVEAMFKEGKIAFPLGMENGSPIENDLANVAHFHSRGVRYITLTHSKVNQICDSSYDKERKWNGLSPFGEEVVQEMNKVGIMVDISHVSDSAFYDALAITESPVIASHSSCRAFTPDWERNMNDEMIQALAENGGVIQINFGSSFLEGDSQKKFDKLREVMRKWAEKNNKDRNDPEYKEYRKAYIDEHGGGYSHVSVVADHIDHVVNLVGVNHVGFGSDFDGVGDTLPTGLKDVSEYPNLILELLKRGYSEEDIEKICYGNVARVWREVEQVAQKLQAG
ncbi:MAG: dipeptidase [Bacteroidota bacterium]